MIFVETTRQRELKIFLVIYSLDFARERLGADIKGKNGERLYTGIIDVYRKIYSTDGLKGLYRGYTLSVFGIFLYRAVYFGLYDSLKPLLQEKYQRKFGFLERYNFSKF